ncbi:MAG TPA: DNA methyltransferase [Chloroflexota bacterium]|nr:DNA methyltransferase [Chloroflexota bacterium]
MDAQIDIGFRRSCSCPPSHLNCLDAKSWMKAQIGVWQFYYESRDLRDKSLHPAVFPIALAKRAIELFTHRGELVLDPFVGSGTTLVACRDLERNAVGVDLCQDYVTLTEVRLSSQPQRDGCRQLCICDDARRIPQWMSPGTVGFIVTSPPYANLLNRRRRNKSRRGELRRNSQYLKVEQYSQDPRDLGTLDLESYACEIREIFAGLRPLLRPGGHCLVNVPDMWWEDRRITLHVAILEALGKAGYELRNTIIWDRTNIVNRIGIFGWPSNYITMGTTFEYLLDFRRPV